jgi:hypothetical protein
VGDGAAVAYGRRHDPLAETGYLVPLPYRLNQLSTHTRSLERFADQVER